MLAKVTGTLFAGIDNNCKDFLTIIFLVKYFGVMLKREGKKKTSSLELIRFSPCVHFSYSLFKVGTETLSPSPFSVLLRELSCNSIK